MTLKPKTNESALLDFTMTVNHISSTVRLVSASTTRVDDAHHMISRLRVLLGDQQATFDYSGLYEALIDALALLSERVHSLASEAVHVGLMRYSISSYSCVM